jgi:NADH dehydrogenase
MSKHKIVILGGTGFVGRCLTARLCALGHEVTILTRRRERHRDLLVLPTVQVIEGDVHNPVLLRREFQGKDTVINLVGILNETGHDGRGFERVHAELPAKVVTACRESGVRRLLHMSALKASESAPSHYLRSKARGEARVLAATDLQVTSFRPSVIFGPDDSFTRRFAKLLKLTPLMFPLACPQARFQPVFVEDVAQAFIHVLDLHQSFGQAYELCGPTVYTLRELLQTIANLIGVKTRIVSLNDGLSRLQAMVLEYFPGKPFSLDNYRSLQIDGVCDRGFPPILGVTPARFDEVVPSYLGSRQPAG